MRAFIAIKFPAEILDEIGEIQEEIEEKELFEGKFTEKENLHLTLKFLGEIDEGKVEKIKEELKKIKFERFEARISEIGVFDPEFIRIIWMRIDGGEILKLQKEIDERLKGFFEKEKRFMSHVTIARVKKCDDKKKLIAELRDIRVPESNFLVREFYLIKSVLGKEKAEYEVLGKFELS
jgi:2'-5' RNA ligase